MAALDRDLIERLSAPVPRYTSYPTANHFSSSIGHEDYANWLGAIAPGTRLSLYVHIPFCHALCWYCACSTKAVRRYEPVAHYVGVLLQEIAHIGALLPAGLAVEHVHWGGGSPSILAPTDIARIAEALARAFPMDEVREHAVEVDPRLVDVHKVAAFAAAGVDRVSLGVQDFDASVQKAIGRAQSFADTARVVDLFRAAGVRSVNIDIVYGLPHQTSDSLRSTLDQVVTLAPDRVAAFGYAHLPQRVAAQRLIDTAALPAPLARLAQSRLIAEVLAAAGYRRIGLDHFARAGDSLAQRRLHRNFQGYTSDAAGCLIGLGASAIGKLHDGYVQNAVATHDYERRIATQGLATARGIALSQDDRVRAFAIERLMCDLRLSFAALQARFGDAARPVRDIATALADRDRDGLVLATREGVEITERGRPFARSICASFDSYLAQGDGRHSVAV